jgi:signal transduction histidine kinase
MLSGDAPCFVDGDTFRLRQVLANLLDNARHATAAGGRVTVSLDRGRGRVVVEVEDDGPGVPEPERERIFERFVRLDASRSRDRFGSGLGLPIARGLAEAHGGSLVCLGGTRGACFRLTLPAVPAAEDEQPDEPAVAVSSS